jgi:hypothetical protein
MLRVIEDLGGETALDDLASVEHDGLAGDTCGAHPGGSGQIAR